ncbi:MAG: hypothetical protein Q9164_007116, partial [Protoblastenia rupestris]
MPERVLTRFDDRVSSITKNESHTQLKGSTSLIYPSNGKKRKRESSDANQKNGSLTSYTPKLSHKQSSAFQSHFQPHRSRPQNSPPSSYAPHRTTAHAPSPIQPISHDTSPQIHSHLKTRAKTLWPQRKALPIWSHTAAIRQGLRSKDIMLLVGETGSGKSTQVPQMLIQEPWFKTQVVEVKAQRGDGTTPEKVRVGGCIAITEPRRVAAISLARRVAEEMGTPLGGSSPASKVGYSVRFDNSCGPATRIKYLTEGMLLQEILRDPWLRSYSAVVVDEVHERGVNVDLILGLLRRMVVGKEGLEERGGMSLKVAVMSATAEVEKLLDFFAEEITENGVEAVNGHVNGQVDGHQEVKNSESESEWSGISTSDSDEGAKNGKRHSFQSDPAPKVNAVTREHAKSKTNDMNDINIPPNLSLCHIEGRQHPVKIHYTPSPVRDFVDVALRTIFQIHHKEPMPGDILVFLTGQEVVESLESLVNEYALGLGPELPKMLVLPLFAALPQVAQQRVFQPAPPKTRKVILATNIAETSVTVSGVRFVIDCGKAKIKHFRTGIGLESLLVKPISKSAAIQRKGRAGREAPGQCYRLYTEDGYLGLQKSNTPEILRCDLSHAILTMKARGVDDVTKFPFLDKPPRDALEKALLLLLRLGALNSDGSISAIGQQMAKLPLSVQLSRTLIAASHPTHNCIEAVIDIISSLSVETIFLNLTSEESKEAAETSRRALHSREGDHLTLLTTIRAYAAEHTNRKAWCETHFISHRAMRSVMDVRKQLRSLYHHHLSMPNNLEHDDDGKETTIQQQVNPEAILRAFLTGFAMNTARLLPDGSYKTIVGNQT